MDRDSSWTSFSDCMDDRRRDSGISMGSTDGYTYCEKLDESRGFCERGITSVPPRFSFSQVFISEDKPSRIPRIFPGLKIDQGVKEYFETVAWMELSQLILHISSRTIRYS